ncbi:HPr family phosphocarrier protein [Woeseia oceani]|uniref:HPr domain-containing protein n=1 Tax=Woeseia oceani TaxID=1548547 RepID=A0A193LCP9_9GAMM|nr:HPr family phosphocarrier protein [Woeseia oceani]ANO50169.1 hypothetical protein BA177_02085 [Woeseia oceani]
MIRQTVTVSDRLGIHARPSARIARIASQFQSRIEIAKGEQSADAASALDIMMLAMESGSVVEISAEGTDAEEALAAIVALFGRE